MNPEPQIDRDNDRIGRLTITCRYVCSALVAAPFFYVNLVTDGDAYLLLALVLLSPIAGIILIGNSTPDYCTDSGPVTTFSANNRETSTESNSLFSPQYSQTTSIESRSSNAA